MKTTLNNIRKYYPCEDSWKKLLNHLGKTEADNKPLKIKIILDVLGVEDAIWALRAVDGYDKEIRLFACDCAESVLNLFEEKYPNDTRPRKAIETARQFANGECELHDLIRARNAALDATWDASGATWYAAWAAKCSATYTAKEAVKAAWHAERATVWHTVYYASSAETEKQFEFLVKYV